MTIAIVGAGIAGAACAAQLQQSGRNVVVFDKGRVAGGRMSSKRAAAGYLDLGAQYFTARTKAFALQCQQWLDAGVVERWTGRIATYQQGQFTATPDDTVRFVGIPSMQAPVGQMLDEVTLHSRCLIERVQFNGTLWQLFDAIGCVGEFSQLVLAVPQQQAAQLLTAQHRIDADLTSIFGQAALLPCWAVDLQLATPLPLDFDGIFVKQDTEVSWLARQSIKSGRCAIEHWLLHFTPSWSEQHLEADKSQIVAAATSALQRISGHSCRVVTSQAHRWRYAQQAPDFGLFGALHRPQLALTLCGDWLNGGRVENAWLSGVQAAEAIML
ncbi:NAD(P)/FAD-dependent oxidoreductase [Rheinheimera maricola]|uniref:FAD-dependent oxidoreductase n=1 Tax=Rheinheimera maricola TaxID=2793282 RepID=A0ABS7X9W6_9GAMM|nr:FAD-dependent oxidoreductase [Rheinheimera maricola]MBZ9611969.1 FAD-dependent oxidoreductase [Rheinheimera maricola]